MVEGKGSSECLSEKAYFDDHGKELGFSDPLENDRKFYEFTVNTARSHIQFEGLLAKMTSFLLSIADRYADGHPELLYYPSKPSDLQLATKSYTSMLNKIYRINYLRNANYPSPPDSGFVKKSSIYSHDAMNDLLRMRLVCKYMDGAKFVLDAVSKFCKENSLGFKSYPKYSDDGYHAWHCYIKAPIPMVVMDRIEDRDMWIELQVTTQLAEVITALTHGLYEQSRIASPASVGDEWRWNPRSQQFRSTYLGHTLHLLEGVIQTFRDEVLCLNLQSISSLNNFFDSATSAETDTPAGCNPLDEQNFLGDENGK